MKKWMLVVLVLAGSVSWGQAQIKIGNRTINTKKVLNAASEVASAITLSDEDVAALCRESVKWMDEQNKEQDIRQEDIRLYYYNNTTGKAEILPQKLHGKDGVFFMAQPSIFINHSGMLDVTWFYANANEDMSFGLYHTTYEQQSVQKADYTAVNEAIDKVNALNKNDYEDFSAVTDAVNAVEYDKDYTEQETVEVHAKAIEKAI